MVKTPSRLHMRSQLKIISNIHYVLLLATAVQITIYDAGRLWPPVDIFRFWVALGCLTIVNTVVWYISRNQFSQPATIKRLIVGLVVADIAYASFLVYNQRGMASQSVIMYVVPILTAAALARRSAVIASAVLSTVAYVSTCVAYFVLNFNEGYKLELYGQVGFFSALFIILASLLWAIDKHYKTPK